MSECRVYRHRKGHEDIYPRNLFQSEDIRNLSEEKFNCGRCLTLVNSHVCLRKWIAVKFMVTINTLTWKNNCPPPPPLIDVRVPLKFACKLSLPFSVRVSLKFPSRKRSAESLRLTLTIIVCVNKITIINKGAYDEGLRSDCFENRIFCVMSIVG